MCGCRFRVQRTDGAKTIRFSNGAASVVAFEVADTGIGIPSEKQTHHLRGLPTGRCRHQPQIRRNRSGSGDQSRTGELARRRNSAAQRARARAALYAVPAADLRGTLGNVATDDHGPSASSDRHCSSPVAASLNMPIEQIADDRDNLQPDDAVLLIVEDDPHYARVLLRSCARQGIQGPGRACAEPKLWRWHASFIRRRFRWMCSCRTCWAGRS